MGTRRFKTPGAERLSALEAATQLMAEREKYEQWLEDLEAKKDSTPAKVFDRVRQDYLARLQTVMEQLGQHTATLQEHAENLMTKLRELEAAEDANLEEQAEAALRKQVGEITNAEWESGSRKAQRELAKLKENQVVILSDLNRIRDLLGGDDEDGGAKPAESSEDFNELEFLSSVVGTTPPAAEPVPTKKPQAQRDAKPSAASTPSKGVAAELGQPKPKAATPSAPAAAQAPPAAPTAPAAAAPARATPPASKATPVADATPPASKSTPVADATPPAVTPSAPMPAQTAATQPAREAESPHVPRASGMAEQRKTLKCTECGTMNNPSEWYCERCGAELTVV